ncbi:amidohydrolase family protein [Acidihalobacter ferrooxydans]|uniref:Guanine deaminase n=1 Tax=Acidihalobacter ferrooxydans TaxID=1765967 RepID=A0A1P8UDI2_9GAMM|nr:amidohydrolase family protein [Acidihalobacter ferrooxydans]APZ41844.1 guanine deaminase [Acidihalobacter ferrooxydans]
MSAATVYRATILNPQGPERMAVYADGALRVREGRIEAVGAFDALSPPRAGDTLVELDGVLVPGFYDVHIHWVQHRVRGRFAAELMPWLREYIWPEEARYGDAGFAAAAARTFFADTVRAGTVAGLCYSSPHPEAVRVAVAAAQGDWLIGDAVMPEYAPAELRAASIHTVDELDPLARELGPARYAITPRFALNCPAPLLAALGAYAQAHGHFVQTHLSESPQEIREVAAAFPEAEDYTDVYDRAGLLGPRSVLGHCIHLAPREWRVLAARGCRVAHCPSSNEALDSGRMPLERVREHGVHWALASDVGAGPSHAMLHVMQRFLAQHRAAGVPVTGVEALYRATLAGAECMGRAAQGGNFEPDKRADFVLLPRPGGTPDAEGWLADWTRGTQLELESRPLGTCLAGQWRAVG